LFANVNICSFLHAALWFNRQGRNEGARGRNFPAPNHFGGAEIVQGRQMIARAPKIPNNVTRTFFNTVYSLPEDLQVQKRERQACILPRAPS